MDSQNLHEITKTFDCTKNTVKEYECPRCLNFQTHCFTTLKQHLREDHSNASAIQPLVYECEKCSFETFSKYLLLKHKLSNKCVIVKRENAVWIPVKASDELPPVEWWQCGQCPLKFNLETDFKKHLKKHRDVPNTRQRFHCTKCRFKALNEAGLKKHIINNHVCKNKMNWIYHQHYLFKTEKDDDVELPILKTETPIVEGKRVKKEKEPYKCGKCSFETKYKRSLSQHLVRHEQFPKHQVEIPSQAKSEVNKWIIYKGYTNKAKTKKLLKHLKTTIIPSSDTNFNSLDEDIPKNLDTTKQGTQIKWFRCGRCSFITLHKVQIERHVSRTHSKFAGGKLTIKRNLAILKCQQCQFETSSERSFNTHMAQRHIGLAKFQCAYCPLQFKTKVLLLLHVGNEHPETRQFQCHFCTYENPSTSKLLKHLEATHADDDWKWFQCHYCTYATGSKSHLLNHLEEHHK